ncbi:unnamed protein product [Closterium sp. Naga37s-1]|nr:unnamed protein product [Closterium sp. Naga37s-1]
MATIQRVLPWPSAAPRALLHHVLCCTTCSAAPRALCCTTCSLLHHVLSAAPRALCCMLELCSLQKFCSLPPTPSCGCVCACLQASQLETAQAESARGSGAGQGGQAYPDKEPQPFPWRERQHHFPERDHQQQFPEREQQQFPEREQQQFPEREPQPFPEREHQQFPEKIPHGSGVFGEEGVVLDRPGAEEEKRTEVKASVGQGKEDEDEDGKDGDEGDEEKEEKEEKDAGGKSEGGQKGDEEESDEGSGEGEAGGKKEKKAGDKGESEDEEDGEDDEEDDEEEGGGKEGKKGRSEAGTGSGKKAQDEEGEKEDEEDEEEKEKEKEAKEEAREGEEGSHSSGEGAEEEDEGAGPADDSAAGDAGGDGGGGGSEGENSSSGGGEATGESAGSSEQQSVAAKEVVSTCNLLTARESLTYSSYRYSRKVEEAAAVAADLVGEPIDVEGCRGRTVYIHKLSLPLSPPSPSISLYSAPLIQKAEAAAVAADPVGEPIDVEGCRGRTVYIHKLAQAYNRGLVEQCATLLPWFSICPHFQNDGLGNRIRNSKLLLPSGRWFETHMYALEMVFHYRLRKAYKCITSDPDKADLFFIPFYASLDVTRWHFAKNASLDDRDRMHDGLAKWLMRREHFKKRNGADHFIVLGQGSWDFRRSEGSQWGNRLLLLPEMKHVTKLVLAANLWEDTEIGIPPLTFFHPRWEKDYKTWQRIAESHRRTSLAAFASLRDAFSKHNKALGRQCKKAKACRYLECVEDICTRPEVLMDLFTDAAFCIVPSGHTGARRAAFDAIVAGCIPVFLDSFVPSQYKWHLPANSSTYSVTLSEKAVLAGKVDVIKELEKIPGKEVRRMRLKIIREVMPAVVYNHPRMYPMEQKRDAFDIAMEEVVRRVQRNKQAAAAA